MPCSVCGKEEKLADERVMYICSYCIMTIPALDKATLCRIILKKEESSREEAKFIAQTFLGFLPTESYLSNLESGSWKGARLGGPKKEDNLEEPEPKAPMKSKRL